MIRVTALLIALSSALAAASLADGSREPERRAQLTLMTMEPLTLRGTRFFAAEKVKLTVVAADERFVRWPTASRGGAFTQRFPTLFVDRCDGVIAVAVGSRGSRATLKPFKPACPPRL